MESYKPVDLNADIDEENDENAMHQYILEPYIKEEPLVPIPRSPSIDEPAEQPQKEDISSR